MFQVENTTYTGVDKTFTGIYDCEESVCDWKGRKVIKGEEYYIFDTAGIEVYVNIEDVREYLNDYRLDVECYDQLIILIEVLHDNYPVIM